MDITLKIDGQTVSAPAGLTLRQAALKNGIYVPGLCSHPDLAAFRGTKWSALVYRGEQEIRGDFAKESAEDEACCNLCWVALEGATEPVRACEIKAEPGMVVSTQGPELTKLRQEALARILAHHPHACLTCAQKQGCSLTQCSSNVPVAERCCILLNRCELGKIVDYVGFPEATPKYVPEGFPRWESDPFFLRDYELCIGCTRCVRICNEVRGVQALGATLLRDRIRVGTTQPGALAESLCRFCGACVEVCPTGALLDKSDAKPVHYGDAAPCVDACPAGIDIPAYIRHIAVGDYAGALRVIYDRVPFPGVLGYVCFHPCEAVCKRNDLDGSVGICTLKRFAWENANRPEALLSQRNSPSGKKVAILGAGPAGLTAAFYLARAGHTIEVFDAADQPGGMLSQAIPEYRLPLSVLNEELQVLNNLGITFRMGQRLGENATLESLRNSEFEAILLALGTPQSRRLGVPGEDLPEIIPVMEFLNSIRQGRNVLISGKVVVIGGGNVAVDAAMSARRLGADHVTMVCLESREQMPAHSWELEQALAEGVAFNTGWGPIEFRSENGRLSGILFKRCTQVFDDQGRFNPQYDDQDTCEIAADYAIIAIGQKIEVVTSDDDALAKLVRNGLINAHPETYQTSLQGVFAAGDAVSGPKSVIDAIAAGRRAADSIDRALGGNGIDSSPQTDSLSNDPFLGRDETFHQRPAIASEQLNPKDRIKGFELLEKPISAQQAESIALRCLRCNLRATITPVILPPDRWQALNLDTVAAIPLTEGVYQLADANRKIIKISGTQDLRAALEQECKASAPAALFCWEEDHMYSRRESELLGEYLREHGQMPGGGASDLDDLF